jgi:hypothetical protein
MPTVVASPGGTDWSVACMHDALHGVLRRRAGCALRYQCAVVCLSVCAADVDGLAAALEGLSVEEAAPTPAVRLLVQVLLLRVVHPRLVHPLLPVSVWRVQPRNGAVPASQRLGLQSHSARPRNACTDAHSLATAPVAACWCRVPSANCRVPSAHCRVPSANCRVPIANCRVSTANNCCNLSPPVTRSQARSSPTSRRRSCCTSGKRRRE